MYSPNKIFVSRTELGPQMCLVKAEPALDEKEMEPERGIEPRTYALRVRCSTV